VNRPSISSPAFLLAIDKTFFNWATTLGIAVAINKEAGFGVQAAALFDHLVLVGTGAVGAEVAVTGTGLDGVGTPLLVLRRVTETVWVVSLRRR